MKYFYLTISLSLCCLITLAQKQNVYFLKNDGTRVRTRDSADYIRVVREPDAGSELYNVLEYFSHGEKKMFGKSSTVDPIRLEGACTTFYKNGKRKQTCEYKANKQTGIAYNFFPNGQIHTIKHFGEDSVETDDVSFNRSVSIQQCNDSTGKALVTNGSGHYVGYDDDYKYVNEEGDVKNGQMDGEWNGLAENKKIKFKEIYKNGHLISGIATDSTGEAKIYHQRITSPSYPDGMDAFYQFLKDNIQYPNEDEKKGIQGKVVLSFVVGKNGKVKKIKVLRSVTPSMNAEAIRVLSISTWQPGTAFGRTAAFSYVVPIVFTIRQY